jgi:hypothetical protein
MAEAVEATGTAAPWLAMIETSERAFEAWRTRAKKIENIFTEQRRSSAKSKRRYSMLWANVSTLKPVVYAKSPQPVVIRRFRDKDRIAKQAGEMVERSIIYAIEKTNFDAMMRNARDDYLLVGRGTAWARYEADTEPMINPLTGQQALDADGKPAEKIVAERVVFDYVHWRDFGHAVARTWEEVPAVWRKAYMDRESLVKRFGDRGKMVSLDHGPESSSDNAKLQDDAKRKATVYEIADKAKGKFVWVAKGSQHVLDEQPPMADLEGFFPCPKPAYATRATDSLIPVPDYVYYQDQAEQIDDLTAKIDKLTDGLKLVGFYPAGTEGTLAIQKAMKPSSEEVLVPIAGWTAFAERGGSNQIQWVPMDMVVKVLDACHQNRQLLIQDIYQITGLSDIIRGESNPQETATAQNIKSQWGSIRVRERQEEIQRFARDCIRIMAEIVAEKFQAETLIEMTGQKLPTRAEVQQQQAMQAAQMGHNGGPPMMEGQGQPAPQAPQPAPQDPPVTVEDVMELLQNDKMRGYRIDVETDSTIAANEEADKQSWNELLTAFSGLMQQALPVGQQEPELVPVLGEIMLATSRKYRAGRSLEDAIETAMEAIIVKSKAPPQPPPPDPAIEKAKAQVAVMEKKSELDSQAAQQDMALEREKFAMESRHKAMDHAHGREMAAHKAMQPMRGAA